MKLIRLSIAILFFAVLAIGSAQERITLRFVSLAWQEQAIASVRSIVDEWNANNPNVFVEYHQVDWGTIHDYLITSFETRSVPDVFHYEAFAIRDFGLRGFLTDLGGMLSEDLQNDIVGGAWATVEEEGRIWGVPFLWESLIVLYNKELFAEAGIVTPTIDDPWTWEELQEAARQLTKDTNGDGTIDQYGAAFGLRSPVNRILNLSLSFGGEYFYKENGEYVIRVGEREQELLNIIMRMMYEDRSASQDGVGLSGPELFPGFYEGRYAMLVGIGVWARQQIVANGPADFNWGVLPPVVAETPRQGSNTQTLSIPADAQHKEASMQFIEFFLNSENMAALAQGDWLLPTRTSSFERPEFQTEEAGWNVAAQFVRYLDLASWQLVPNFAEFRTRVATPIFQELFANRITVEEAARRLEEEGNPVIRRR